MSQLTEMIDTARQEMEVVRVTFTPIVNYPVSCTI